MGGTDIMAVVPFTTLVCVSMSALVVVLVYVYRARRHTPKQGAVHVALVINLAHRPERLAAFTSTYEASDLAPVPLRRIEAFDGRSLDWSRFLSDEALERLHMMRKTGYRMDHPDLTPGAVGCYLSHVQAWREVARSGAAVGLVFEDDAQLPAKVMPTFEEAMRDAPDDWDILCLGHFAQGDLVSPRLVRVSLLLGLFAYAVSARAARSLPSRVFPITQQLDWELSRLIRDEGLKVYAVNPAYVKIYPWKTDIQTPLAGQEMLHAPAHAEKSSYYLGRGTPL